MPDRYGDRPDDANPFAAMFPDDLTTEREQQASQAAESILRAHAIAECQLCDDSGIRNRFPCDHVDHRPAYRRGIAAVREAMGWTPPDEDRR